MSKIDSFVNGLRECQLEFFYLFIMYGLMVQSSAVTTQLIEDKICLNQLGLELKDCFEEESTERNVVLKETSLITSYSSVLTKIPSIVTTFFVGTWINNYPSHLKFIILMPCVSSILQIFILVGNVVFFKLDAKTILIIDLFPWVFGTFKNTFMALATYIVLTHPPEKRIIKFASVEVASLVGQYTGGWIFDQKPWFPGQSHNFLGVFIFGFAFKVVAVLFFIIKVPNVYKVNAKKLSQNPKHGNHNLPMKPVKEAIDQSKKSSLREFVTKVFSYEALIRLFTTLFRKREAGRKGVLLLLVLADIILLIQPSFRLSVAYQFSQKAYHWSTYEYSKYNSIVRVIPAIIQLLAPRLFIQKLGISDLTLGLLAILSHAAEQFILGSWLATEGFMVATISGCLFTLFNASVRSLISCIVDSDEVGGIFSLLTAFGSVLTLVTDWFLIRLFNATLSTSPGLCFHMFSTISLIPFTIFLWIKFKRSHLITKKRPETHDQSQEIENEGQTETIGVETFSSNVVPKEVPNNLVDSNSEVPT